MGQYRAGAVDVTNSSNVVTGTDTEFLAYVEAGDEFSIAGSGVTYEVAHVTSNLQLELSASYAGLTALVQPYAITTSFTPVLGIPYIEAGDIDTPTTFKRAMLALEALISGGGTPVSFASGTAGAPGAKFSAEPTSGLFLAATGQIGIAILGTAVALLTSTGLNATVIGATTPAAVHATTLSATGASTLAAVTATTLNKVTVTAPAAAATLTLANNSTLATVGAFTVTLTATAGSALTLPTAGTLSTLAGVETLTNKTLTSPTLTTPVMTGFVDIQPASGQANLRLGAGATGNSSANVYFLGTNTQRNWNIAHNIYTPGALEFAASTADGGSTFNSGSVVLRLTSTGAAVVGNLTASGNMTVDGDLLVSGAVVTFNTSTVSVEDSLMKLANSNTADVVDVGLYALYQPVATPLYSGIFRDATDGKWKIFKDLQAEPTTTVNIAGTGYAVATLVANIEGNLTGAVTGNASTATALATARAINGTNFDGTAAITITAAAGTLTGATLAAGVTASSLTSLGTIAALVAGTGAFSGVLSTSDTTDATNISTGASKNSGGASVTKALWVGGLANIAGAVTLQSTLAVTGTSAFSALATVTLAADGYGLKVTRTGGATAAGYADTIGGYFGTSTNHPTFLMANGSAILTGAVAGHIGIGVTPSAWSSGKALEVGNVGNSLWSAGVASVYLVGNAYYNSGFKFAGTGYATAYSQDAGGHYWFTSSASGTAGNAATLVTRMSMGAGGSLTVTSNEGSHTLSSSLGDSNALYIYNNAATAGQQYGVRIDLTGDPNSTGNYFARGIGNATTRWELRANGGLANFSANNVTLSDLIVKPFTRVHDTTVLWDFGKRMRAAWMQFKYNDQAHDDWNNGYGAQLVQIAAGADFPELVELSNWGTKDKPVMRLSVYDSDLMHIMGAITTESQYRIDDHELRLTEQCSEFEKFIDFLGQRAAFEAFKAAA